MVPGLANLGKTPRPQKLTHVWKKGDARFNRGCTPFKKIGPGVFLSTSFQKFIHKSF